MSKSNISGYYCNKCGRNYLNYLKTGDVLLTPEQSGNFQIHISSSPRKPKNGVFHFTDDEYYRLGARTIGNSGFLEVESGGEVNAYLDFGSGIGYIERYGIRSGEVTLGKAVLINYPDFIHWFPAANFGIPIGFCSICKLSLFGSN